MIRLKNRPPPPKVKKEKLGPHKYWHFGRSPTATAEVETRDEMETSLHVHQQVAERQMSAYAQAMGSFAQQSASNIRVQAERAILEGVRAQVERIGGEYDAVYFNESASHDSFDSILVGTAQPVAGLNESPRPVIRQYARVAY